MSLLFNLLKNTAAGILLGIILLLVASFVLPEKIFIKVIQRIKPDITLKTKIMEKVRTVFDYLFNDKKITFTSSKEKHKSNEQKICDLMQEKRCLEGNIFFLDLLKNLSGMLYFSTIQSGYDINTACTIIDKSMEYLQYYSCQIVNTDSSQNQSGRIDLAAEELKNSLMDTASFLNSNNGQEALKTAHITLTGHTKSFDSFMKLEYESSMNNLQKVNQILAELLIDYIQV